MTYSKSIAFIATSHSKLGSTEHSTGVWLEELAAPYYELKDAGFTVEIFSIAGGAIPVDPHSVQDKASLPRSVERFLKDSAAQKAVQKSRPITELDSKEFDGMFLPGGHGVMWDLPNNQTLAAIIRKFDEDGKIVAAVCHGSAGFVTATRSDGQPFVAGRRLAPFTNSEERTAGLEPVVPFMLETRLRELGAQIQSGPDQQPFAIRDGNVITGQNPASSTQVARLIVDALRVKAAA